MEREEFGWLLWFVKVRSGKGHSWPSGISQGKWTWIGGARRETQCWKKDGVFSFRYIESLDTKAGHWVLSSKHWSLRNFTVMSKISRITDNFPAHQTSQCRTCEAALSAVLGGSPPSWQVPALSPGREIFGWSAAWHPGADSAVTATARSSAHTRRWGAARWWYECCDPHSKTCLGGLCVFPSWKH